MLETLKSGGPRSVGSIGSLGSGFLGCTWGGVNWVHANFGNLPRFTGVVVWSLAPPPPPAGLAPGGILAMYGEMSIRPTSVLFLACVDEVTRVRNGTMSRPMTSTWRLIEMIWVQPKFSSLDQMSLTRTGFTSKGSGACLVGENSSLRRVPKPPKPSTQPVPRRLLEGPLGTGRLEKNSRTLSQKPWLYCA